MSEPRPAARTAMVAVHDLTVDGPHGNRILDGIDLTVDPGRIVALVGSSGTGKTTLLRTLTGALPIGFTRRRGTVHVMERPVLELTPRALRELRATVVSFVGQDPASRLNPRMRVRQLLTEVATEPGVDACRRLLAEVHLPATDDLLRRRPRTLSGGQARRVALARALASGPRLLLLDEPTAGLDHALRDNIAQLLRDLATTHGMTVVAACHDLTLAERIADTTVELRHHPAARRSPTPTPPAATAPGHTRTTPAEGPGHTRTTPAEGPGHTRTTPGPARPGTASPAVATTPREPGTRTARPALLRLRGISASAGGDPILREVGLEVMPGAAVAVTGPSGAGKTTLARVIAGLHRPASGTAEFDGRALHPRVARRDREQRRRIQLVPQDPLGSLNPTRTVAQALARPLRLHRRAHRHDVVDRVHELLDQVGLPVTFAGRRPHELSGGQRQRVAVARALAAEPDLLICDEITSALDPHTAESLMRLLSRVRAQRGLSVLLISHDLDLVARHCDSVVVMAAGETRVRRPLTATGSAAR